MDFGCVHEYVMSSVNLTFYFMSVKLLLETQNLPLISIVRFVLSE